MDAATRGAAGLARFARYASPPNQRGYCGPADHAALLAYARSGVVDEQLRGLAAQFDGPLPYLRTIAAAAGIDDPFDDRVVTAYWLGGGLAEDIDADRFAAEVEATFRGQPTVAWERVVAALPGGTPTHCWHVLVTYPWLGLLDHPGQHAIGVLDSCRIRAGEVVDVGSDGTATVVTRPLQHSGGQLHLGPPRVETGVVGLTDGPPLEVGMGVALHWEWICDTLSDARTGDLERSTAAQLALVNRAIMPLLR